MNSFFTYMAISFTVVSLSKIGIEIVNSLDCIVNELKNIRLLLQSERSDKDE